MASLRRSKAFSPDSQAAKFLYTILKQLDLKSVDWQTVAEALDITNGHAARMRYSRLKQQIEGLVGQSRSTRPRKSRKIQAAVACGFKDEDAANAGGRLVGRKSTVTEDQSGLDNLMYPFASTTIYDQADNGFATPNTLAIKYETSNMQPNLSGSISQWTNTRPDFNMLHQPLTFPYSNPGNIRSLIAANPAINSYAGPAMPVVAMPDLQLPVHSAPKFSKPTSAATAPLSNNHDYEHVTQSDMVHLETWKEESWEDLFKDSDLWDMNEVKIETGNQQELVKSEQS